MSAQIASVINDVLVHHHVSRSTGCCDCGYVVPLGGSFTEHQAGLAALAITAIEMSDDPFAGAVLILAATVEACGMTDEEATRFWERLGTYALDVALDPTP